MVALRVFGKHSEECCRDSSALSTSSTCSTADILDAPPGLKLDPYAAHSPEDYYAGLLKDMPHALSIPSPGHWELGELLRPLEPVYVQVSLLEPEGNMAESKVGQMQRTPLLLSSPLEPEGNMAETKVGQRQRTPLSGRASAFIPQKFNTTVSTVLAQEKFNTTVMLCSLPKTCSRDMLVSTMESKGFAQQYDFVYVPTNLSTMLSLGYAFVNLITNEAGERFLKEFDGFDEWASFDSGKCVAKWSKLQGLMPNVQRYQNSRIMNDSVPDLYKPAMFKDGVRVPFPKATKGILRAPKCKFKSRALEAKDDHITCFIENCQIPLKP